MSKISSRVISCLLYTSLRKGKIAQDGSPREIYEDPANLFVARFIGEINVFDATVIERKSDDELLANVEGRICDIHTSISAEKGQKLQVLLRPEDIDVYKRQN